MRFPRTITSLLTRDRYEFSMGQAICHRFIDHGTAQP